MQKKWKDIVLIGLIILVVVGAAFFSSELSNQSTITLKEFHNTDLQTYMSLYTGEKDSLVYVGSSQCSHCTSFSPVLKRTASKYNVDVYYIDIASYSQDDLAALYDSNQYFTAEDWGTPLLLVVGNSSIKTSSIGEVDNTTLVNFLKTAGLTNE